MTDLVSQPVPHRSSFRDSSGYIFESNACLYRAVNRHSRGDIESLFTNGLYQELASQELLVPHQLLSEQQSRELGLDHGWIALKILNRLPIISYHCEWTDAQLCAAALLTLDIQKRALSYGFCLKDATSFNVQFLGEKPVFIDILSFTTKLNMSGWVAYRQFCEHFIAPLAIHKYRHEMQNIPGPSLDGVALGSAASLLPIRTWFVIGLLLHIHIHSRFVRQFYGRGDIVFNNVYRSLDAKSKAHSVQLMQSLRSVIKKLEPIKRHSSWANYRNENTYTAQRAKRKLDFIKRVIERIKPERVLDLGANDGHYSLEVAKMGIPCTAVEVDNTCCEIIYAASKSSAVSGLINTVRVDLTNPTPAHGWAHEERTSFSSRFACDMTLALALLHHLTIAKQIPYRLIAEYFAKLSPDLIIEYIPWGDPMLTKLLHTKSDVNEEFLDQISHNSFLAEFGKQFECIEEDGNPGESERIMYHFHRRSYIAA